MRHCTRRLLYWLAGVAEGLGLYGLRDRLLDAQARGLADDWAWRDTDEKGGE